MALQFVQISKKEEQIQSQYKNRLLAVSEVVLAYVSVVGLMWITELIPGFESWQRTYLGKALLSAIFYMVLPGALLFYLHGTRDGKIIFGGRAVKQALNTGGKSLAVMLPATFAFPIAQLLGYDFIDWGGAFIIAAFYLVAIAVLLWMFKDISTTKETGFSKSDGLFAGWIFAGALVVIAVLHQFNPVAKDILIALIFVGFMEEFFFRGYMQPRLNMAFDKPFEILGLKFGWGIVLASALFGLIHVISPGENPLQWSWGFWTFIAGLGFGVIREKGGSFIAPAVVHGITMIFPVVFS